MNPKDIVSTKRNTEYVIDDQTVHLSRKEKEEFQVSSSEYKRMLERVSDTTKDEATIAVVQKARKSKTFYFS